MFLNVQAKSYTSNPPAPLHPASRSTTKALGESADPSLVAWFEEAMNFKNAVEAGQATPPDPTSYQEFLRQITWAKAQLYGTPSAEPGWDPLTEPGTTENSNPYGGEKGPDGNWSYDTVVTKIGFTGENSRNDIFGSDNTLDFDMPSAQVQCEVTTDQGLEVLKVTVTSSKGSAVYFYDNFQSPDFKLKINVADVEQVLGEEILSEKIEVAKFETIDPNAPAEGPAPSATQADNWYVYDGRVGECMEFNPTAGEDETHEVFGDLRIDTLTSDQIDIYPGGPKDDVAGYKIVITHQDGSTDTFYVHEGFYADLQAVPQNVHWHKVKDTGNPHVATDEMAPVGEATDDAQNSEASEIPKIFIPWITLNGQAHEDPAEAATQDWPPALLDYFDLIGIDPKQYESLQVPKSFIEQIENGVMPPSSELLQAMLYSDSALKQSWENYQAHPKDEHAASQVRNLLQSRLKILFPNANIDQDGEFPEGVEADDLIKSKTLFFDGFPYEITADLELERIAADPSVANPDPGQSGRDEDSLANAARLADIPGVTWTAEEIFDHAKKLDIDLSYISFPPSRDIWRLLGAIDTALQQTLKTWMESPSATTTAELRDHLVQILAALYPDRIVESSDRGGKNSNHCNDLHIDGQLYQFIPDSWVKKGPEGIYVNNAWQILADHFS